MLLKDTAFNRITRTSRWLNLALFGILPLLLVLVCAFLWGMQRIVEQKQETLKLNFSILIGYVHAQEQFLGKLRSQTPSLVPDALSVSNSLFGSSVLERSGMQLTKGQNTNAEIAFSQACENASDCARLDHRLSSLGDYLALFYSSYWASSYYPASTIFLIDLNDSISLSAPAIDAPSGYEPLTSQTFLATTDAVRIELHRLEKNHLASIDHATPKQPYVIASNHVHWFKSDALPDYMLGMTYADVPQSAWHSASGKASAVYAVTLLSLERINVFGKTLSQPPYKKFWLSHRDEGTLLGDNQPPNVSKDGLHYTLDGLVFRLSDPTGLWTGTYKVGYETFFQYSLWLPIGAALLLLFSLGSGIAAMRWYSRRVIKPAQHAQRDIVEQGEFSRTLLETAPVALCLLARPLGEIVFGNSLALQWLGGTVGEPLKDTPTDSLLRQALGATGPGTIENFHAIDGRPLYVTYAPTRYNHQDVVLCAFSDISARAEIERTLAQAKQDADRASEAKSTFLATMSHEIRTPLYGLLGTLELMSLTQLDDEQRQHLERMQSSSAILLQQISDILDITKIEAGQLVLESAAFNIHEMIQSCTNSYAPMAEKKGLLLFCCVDVTVPEWAIGDAVRIQQILSNLLSNAIKFSDSGHVIARLKVSKPHKDKSGFLLQVVDTGIGIGKQDQSQLFIPFYQINNSRHTVQGTGIGLPICARLAKLMDAEIHVTSEPGLGSSFSLTLQLPIAPDQAVQTPDLYSTRVFVRSPNEELTENTCLWLNHWGAQATTAPTPLPLSKPDTILLDVLFQDNKFDALIWSGHHVLATVSHKLQSIGTITVSPNMKHIAAGILSALGNGETTTSTAEEALSSLAPLGLRVLVAEDNPINQATLQHQLEQLGCAVFMASDGAEALTLWGLTSYDVVLTDVNMPRMNGYELARELRILDGELPIIGITANAMREEEDRCLAAGMTSWLVKPIELRTLRQHLLARNPARSDLAVETVPMRDGESQKEISPLIPAKYRILFLSTMTEDLREMEHAITGGDPRLLQNTLHRMRGALGIMQMASLADQLEALEVALHNDGLSTHVLNVSKALVNSLRSMLAKV